LKLLLPRRASADPTVDPSTAPNTNAASAVFPTNETNACMTFFLLRIDLSNAHAADPSADAHDFHSGLAVPAG
jgi:hypothetical protein